MASHRPDLTLSITPTVFPDALFNELSAAVKGPVLRPSDPQYPERARTFNGKLKPACRVLVSPLDAHDVSAVVCFCRTHGLSPSVRAGGYGIAGWAVAGDLVIDMSMIRDINIEPPLAVGEVPAAKDWTPIGSKGKGRAPPVGDGRLLVVGSDAVDQSKTAIKHHKINDAPPVESRKRRRDDRSPSPELAIDAISSKTGHGNYSNASYAVASFLKGPALPPIPGDTPRELPVNRPRLHSPVLASQQDTPMSEAPRPLTPAPNEDKGPRRDAGKASILTSTNADTGTSRVSTSRPSAITPGGDSMSPRPAKIPALERPPSTSTSAHTKGSDGASRGPFSFPMPPTSQAHGVSGGVAAFHGPGLGPPQSMPFGPGPGMGQFGMSAFGASASSSSMPALGMAGGMVGAPHAYPLGGADGGQFAHTLGGLGDGNALGGAGGVRGVGGFNGVGFGGPAGLGGLAAFGGGPTIPFQHSKPILPHVYVTFGAGMRQKEVDMYTADHPFEGVNPVTGAREEGVVPYHIPMSAHPVGSSIMLVGGFGFISRMYGLTVDSLVEVEMVLADGRIVIVNAESDPDLWWAIRGAGTAFGIATRYKVRAYPVPVVFAGNLIYRFRRATAPSLIKHFRDCIKGCPRELYANVLLTAGPANADSLVVIQMCYAGPRAEGLEYLQAIASWDGERCLLNEVGEKSFLRQQDSVAQVLRGQAGRQWFLRSTLVTTLSDEVIAQTVLAFADTPIGCTWIFELAGGAIGDFEDTCVPKEQREAPWTVAALHQWDMGIDDPRCITTAEDWMGTIIAPVSTGAPLPALLGRHESLERTKKCFGKNWDRLVALKKKYDPECFFRNNLWPLDKDGRPVDPLTNEPPSP